MTSPALEWNGLGYVDSNFGDEPLENGFTEWDWGRTHLNSGTRVMYDLERRGGELFSLAIDFDANGQASPFEPPPRGPLPRGFWRMRRTARSDLGRPRLLRTLEDAPFYTRSLVDVSLNGTPAVTIQESLSLDRVVHPIVRAMLPFRMPRRNG